MAQQWCIAVSWPKVISYKMSTWSRTDSSHFRAPGKKQCPRTPVLPTLLCWFLLVFWHFSFSEIVYNKPLINSKGFHLFSIHYGVSSEDVFCNDFGHSEQASCMSSVCKRLIIKKTMCINCTYKTLGHKSHKRIQELQQMQVQWQPEKDGWEFKYTDKDRLA